MRVPVLYQDEDLVVIDKPAGMPSQAGKDPYAGDALAIARAQLGRPSLTAVYRLEPEASGVLLLGANPEVAAALDAALAGDAAKRVYLALVRGVPSRPSGVIDEPLARVAGDSVEHYRVTTARDKRGQRAVTHYSVVERDPDEQFSLVEAVPRTERNHQVRVHLAHLGVPIVGDPLYAARAAPDQAQPSRGGSPHGDRGAAHAGHAAHAAKTVAASGPGKRRQQAAAGTGRGQSVAGSARREGAGDVRAEARPIPAPRLALHLQCVTVPHPRTGEPMVFTAPTPELLTRLATGLPEMGLAAARRHIRRIKPGAAGLAELVKLAVGRREPLRTDPDTTLYRLINGEGDGLPGLAVDRYGDSLVVNVYDEGGRPEPLAPALIETLREAAGAAAVYVKYRQREASRVDEEALPVLAPSLPVAGRGPGEYPAYESGLAYLVRPGEGWNPGLFPDMREMRVRVRDWAPGKRVLNCFAYTCGFGVAATAGKAAQVVNLDVSRPVLQRGWANYLANGFAPDEKDFLYGDVFDWLPRLAQRDERFDIVILDPPGFARTKTHVFSAAQNYDRLARAAAEVTAPGGLLVACCNVGDLSLTSFRDRVIAGLDEAWRAGEIVGTYGAPALDFPTPPRHPRGPRDPRDPHAGREDSYLKILVARLR